MADRKPRRSIEELIADCDRRIAKHEAEIENIKIYRESLMNPRPRKSSVKSQIKAILTKANESGMSPDEIAKKLGIKSE